MPRDSARKPKLPGRAKACVIVRRHPRQLCQPLHQHHRLCILLHLIGEVAVSLRPRQHLRCHQHRGKLAIFLVRHLHHSAQAVAVDSTHMLWKTSILVRNAHPKGLAMEAARGHVPWKISFLLPRPHRWVWVVKVASGRVL